MFVRTTTLRCIFNIVWIMPINILTLHESLSPLLDPAHIIFSVIRGLFL